MKKQAILEEIKRKDIGEGLGASLKYLDHCSSSESASGDKTESKRDSDHDKSHNDSKIGDESDKFTSDEEHIESDESDKDSDITDDQTEDFVIKPHDKEPEQPPNTLLTLSPNVTTTSAKDYTTYLNDPRDVQMFELLNEPVQTKATTMMVFPILETIHETQE
ncbi:hypothetical protein Tco_0029618 [Tanacetum coccineum]